MTPTLPLMPDIRLDAVHILSDVLGNEIAVLYRHYYDNKSPQEIMVSLHEILQEYLGERKANEMITVLSAQYHTR
jgi:hypothetical protein